MNSLIKCLYMRPDVIISIAIGAQIASDSNGFKIHYSDTHCYYVAYNRLCLNYVSGGTYVVDSYMTRINGIAIRISV